MLYYIFQYLDKAFDVPGAGVFQYITFRSALAFILSLSIATIYGKKIINYLRKQQVGETVRELGLEEQAKKLVRQQWEDYYHLGYFNSGFIVS